MCAGSPPVIFGLYDFSCLELNRWPQVTKSRKKEEGREAQGPAVKVGWLGSSLWRAAPSPTRCRPRHTEGSGLAR